MASSCLTLVSPFPNIMFDRKPMQPFKATLSNSATLTGLHNLPTRTPTTPTHLPLIVGLHGGTYSAQYFDVDANHTASIASNGLGVPIVAINRPGYQDSTSFYPIPHGSSYPQEYGAWLHQYILPALWSEFGEPYGCNSLVLYCHSLGTTGAVIAASLHAEEPDNAKPYPLAGISISGFGTQRAGQPYRPSHGPDVSPPTSITFPPEVKDSMMLQPGHADPEIYKYTAELNNAMPVEEVVSIESVWLPAWREWAGNVKVPVMVGIAGDDAMWKGTDEHLRDITSAFTGSGRVDGSIVRGAPHNMEMSYWAKGWYARCFGFAMECAVSFAMKG